MLKSQLKNNIPDIRPGQVIRVHEKIQEGDKSRTQVFEGLVIATKHGRGLDGTFTVRKIGAGGVGVERTFPIHMPALEKIEVLRKENVRRAKLYYVREQIGKKTKKRKTKLQELVFDMGGTQEEISDEQQETGDKAEEQTTEESTTETNESAAEKESAEADKEIKEESSKTKEPVSSEDSQGEIKVETKEEEKSFKEKTEESVVPDDNQGELKKGG